MQSPPLRTAKDLFPHLVDESFMILHSLFPHSRLIGGWLEILEKVEKCFTVKCRAEGATS
jgi:hypothetical protein